MANKAKSRKGEIKDNLKTYELEIKEYKEYIKLKDIELKEKDTKIKELQSDFENIDRLVSELGLCLDDLDKYRENENLKLEIIKLKNSLSKKETDYKLLLEKNTILNSRLKALRNSTLGRINVNYWKFRKKIKESKLNVR
jgi:hypothetical protein